LYYRRGWDFYQGEQYDKAISEYNEAIRLDPNNATYYFARGVAYIDTKDYDEAIRDYNKAIKLEPDSAAAYNNRGTAYDERQKYDKAISDYNKAIKLQPNFTSAYHNRGITYRKRARKPGRKPISTKPSSSATVGRSNSKVTLSSVCRNYGSSRIDTKASTVFSSAILEGVSKTEIALNKVGVGATVPTVRNEVVTSLGEDRPIGSKAIFEPAANVPERATPHVSCVIEPRIEIRKARVDRRTVASENHTHPTHEVGRQVNTRPEVIQRQPQHEVRR
jgi:hypothetical protein